VKISALELAMGRTDPGGAKSQRCDEEMAFKSGVNSCHRAEVSVASRSQIVWPQPWDPSILDGSEMMQNE